LERAKAEVETLEKEKLTLLDRLMALREAALSYAPRCNDCMSSATVRLTVCGWSLCEACAKRKTSGSTVDARAVRLWAAINAVEAPLRTHRKNASKL